MEPDEQGRYHDGTGPTVPGIRRGTGAGSGRASRRPVTPLAFLRGTWRVERRLTDHAAWHDGNLHRHRPGGSAADAPMPPRARLPAPRSRAVITATGRASRRARAGLPRAGRASLRRAPRPGQPQPDLPGPRGRHRGRPVRRRPRSSTGSTCDPGRGRPRHPCGRDQYLLTVTAAGTDSDDRGAMAGARTGQGLRDRHHAPSGLGCRDGVSSRVPGHDPAAAGRGRGPGQRRAPGCAATSGSLTFGGAVAAVGLTAEALRDAGVRRGDLVMLTARNTPPYLLLLAGAGLARRGRRSR